MKKNLLLLLTFLPLLASADAIEIDGIYYNLINKIKQAEVTSNPNNYSGSVIIPEQITYEGTTYNVTSIGNSAFYNCRGLTSITIPNSITSIGTLAFGYCWGLTNITIPNGVITIGNSAFSSCALLSSINLPESVNAIGRGAFFNCETLHSIAIPEGVTTIGSETFQNCTALRSVTIPESVTTIDNNAFYKCSNLSSITIPEGVNCIQSQTFYGCSQLSSIALPSSLNSIASDAFYNCSKLSAIYITDLNKWCESSLGGGFPTPYNLYLNNKEINDLVIPNSVSNIGNYAFTNCVGLTSVTISNGVMSIGNHAFQSCTGLTSVTMSNSITSIGNYAFEGCVNLCAITLPQSVNTIDYAAFENCSSLKTITIPQSVKDITSFLFYGCTSLSSITIPNEVTSIGHYAFYGCTNLTSITIPYCVTSIGNYAFSHCSELTDFYCFSTAIPEPDLEPFEHDFILFEGSYIEYATLHVPAASIGSYNAQTPWSDFGTITAIMSEDITIGDLGIGTFCGSNPIDLLDTENVKAYVVSSYEKASGQVTLTRTYYIPPFTGVVVKGNKGVYTIPAGVGQPVFPNMMKGVTTNTVLNKVQDDYTNYVLANKGGNLGFYAVSDGSTLGAGKAYLPLPTADLPTAAREFTLIFDDGETTEIMKVASQEKASQGYYDLQGRRVANPTSGLYIVNGKKVIIK